MNYNCKRYLYTLILQKNYSSFFKLLWRNKRFSPVFGSNRLSFCSYKLQASENNLSEYTEDDGAERYFLAKLARCGYFV